MEQDARQREKEHDRAHEDDCRRQEEAVVLVGTLDGQAVTQQAGIRPADEAHTQHDARKRHGKAASPHPLVGARGTHEFDEPDLA